MENLSCSVALERSGSLRVQTRFQLTHPFMGSSLEETVTSSCTPTSMGDVRGRLYIYGKSYRPTGIRSIFYEWLNLVLSQGLCLLMLHKNTQVTEHGLLVSLSPTRLGFCLSKG